MMDIFLILWMIICVIFIIAEFNPFIGQWIYQKYLMVKNFINDFYNIWV